ncbi:hypothetical protein JW766_03365 [Candidatus Dojkabacteria bacterium]|nr:hypothetical protein [Candidatus Dojkabacteria bacterium]
MAYAGPEQIESNLLDKPRELKRGKDLPFGRDTVEGTRGEREISSAAFEVRLSRERDDKEKITIKAGTRNLVVVQAFKESGVKADFVLIPSEVRLGYEDLVGESGEAIAMRDLELIVEADEGDDPFASVRVIVAPYQVQPYAVRQVVSEGIESGTRNFRGAIGFGFAFDKREWHLTEVRKY